MDVIAWVVGCRFQGIRYSVLVSKFRLQCLELKDRVYSERVRVCSTMRCDSRGFSAHVDAELRIIVFGDARGQTLNRELLLLTWRQEGWRRGSGGGSGGAGVHYGQRVRGGGGDGRYYWHKVGGGGSARSQGASRKGPLLSSQLSKQHTFCDKISGESTMSTRATFQAIGSVITWVYNHGAKI